jgi:hypothetical protein
VVGEPAVVPPEAMWHGVGWWLIKGAVVWYSGCMNKSSVFVAADGQREALVAYFQNNGVRYFSPPVIAETTAPYGVSDDVLMEVGGEAAKANMDDDQVFQYVDNAYPLSYGPDPLGWEVVVYTTDWNDRPGFGF